MVEPGNAHKELGGWDRTNMDVLQGVRHVFEGTPGPDNYANSVGLMFVQSALEIGRQVPGVLEKYYIVLADVNTGNSLFVDRMPRMTSWLRRSPKMDLRKHIQQNLTLLKTNSHVKMFNHDSYRLFLYRKNLLDHISMTCGWKLEKVPKRIAHHVKKMCPDLCQSQNKYDFDSGADVMTLYGCLHQKPLWSKEECLTCKASDVKLKKCNACQKVYYCSKECQTKHWKCGHKDECRDLKGFYTVMEDDDNRLIQFVKEFDKL